MLEWWHRRRGRPKTLLDGLRWRSVILCSLAVVNQYSVSPRQRSRKQKVWRWCVRNFFWLFAALPMLALWVLGRFDRRHYARKAWDWWELHWLRT